MTERSTPLREAMDAHWWGWNSAQMPVCHCGWEPEEDSVDTGNWYDAWADHREQAVRAALASEPTQWPDGDEAVEQLATALLDTRHPSGWPLPCDDCADDARALLAALRGEA